MLFFSFGGGEQGFKISELFAACLEGSVVEGEVLE